MAKSGGNKSEPVFHVFPRPTTEAGQVNSPLLNHNVLALFNPSMSLQLCNLIENTITDKKGKDRILWAFRNALRGHFADRGKHEG